MIFREKKSKTKFILPLLMFFQLNGNCQAGRTAKVDNLYSCLKEYDIECPKTVLAIAIYETGWMECKNCSYQFNNLFGFRANHNYIKFESIYDCVQYLRIWQTAFYDPWKIKHPNGTYYQYLAHIKYAPDMVNYVKTLKHIEGLVAGELNAIDSAPITRPSIETEGR